MNYKLTTRCYDNCHTESDIDYAKIGEMTRSGTNPEYDWWIDIFTSDTDLRKFIVDEDVKNLSSEINNFTDLRIEEAICSQKQD